MYENPDSIKVIIHVIFVCEFLKLDVSLIIYIYVFTDLIVCRVCPKSRGGVQENLHLQPNSLVWCKLRLM